jgi:hypothetical protein
MFSDVHNRIINFDFFQPYFDQVSLPLRLAKALLGDLFDYNSGQSTSAEFIKFIRLSTLRQRDRLPVFQEVSDHLVDYRDVSGFALQGRLSWWGGDDVYSRSPCVFVSHRWQSPDHPDPHGSQLARLLERFRRVRRSEAEHIYFWIDFCCLPQARTDQALAPEQVRDMREGLRHLPGILKSCDLTVLCSSDYLERAWCYSELFVWLCRLISTGYTRRDKKSKLVRSVQTKHLVRERSSTTGHTFDDVVLANLAFRGYDGDSDQLLELLGTIRNYCEHVVSAADYHLGGLTDGFDFEYLPTMVNFLCRSWALLEVKDRSIQSDIELCLRVIMDGLKYSGTLPGSTIDPPAQPSPGLE